MEYQKLGNVIQYVRNFEELQRSITVFIQTTRYIIDHNEYGIYLKMIRIFSLPVSNSSRVIYYVVLIYFFKPLLGLSRILIYRGNISFDKIFVVFFFFITKRFILINCTLFLNFKDVSYLKNCGHLPFVVHCRATAVFTGSLPKESPEKRKINKAAKH